MKIQVNCREKLRFLVFGVINFTATNLILVLLLPTIPTSLASGSAVIFNFLLGYFFNRYQVFGNRSFLSGKNYRYLKLYALVALGSWIIYMICIPILSSYLNVSKVISALLLIPILTIYSYLMQSRMVFNK